MSTDNLAAALAAFQAELPKLGKTNTANTGTYSYRYADLAEVSTLVLPLLAKQGLSFSSKPTIDESGRFVLAYTLRHTSGDSDSGAYPLPTGQPQQVGSAITYARRYVLCAITGIAPDEDDDGQAAKETRVDPQERAWDPIDQEQRREEWEDEIRRAKTDAELDDIAERIRRTFRKRELSKATVDHLRVAGEGRRAGIAQEAADLMGVPEVDE